MEIGHCRDCKWFSGSRSTGHPADDIPKDWGWCRSLGSEDDTPDRADTKAYARPDSHYDDRFGAHMAVAPDFGCVQFSAKEVTDSTLCGERHPIWDTLTCWLPQGHQQQHEQWDKVYPQLYRVQWPQTPKVKEPT